MSSARWFCGVFLALLCATAECVDAPQPAASPSPQSNFPAAPPATQRPEIPTRLSGDLGIRVQRVDERGSAINWTTLLTSLLAAFVGLGGALLVARWSQRGIRQSLAQNVNAAELQELQRKLDSFYGPYMQRSEANRLLAEEFKSHRPNPTTFRTLILLIDPEWRSRLSKSDQTIVSEIVKNDMALSKLIREHAGLVDSQVLQYLSRATVHFRFIELAFDGELENLPSRFDAYVYPRQLDEVLQLEIGRLTDRCETLRRQATDTLGPIPPLNIPEHLALPAWPGAVRPRP